MLSSREILPLQSEKVGFPHPLQQPQPRHQGPARLHRRAHRAQARGTAEAAANAAVPKKLEPAVEADKTVHTTDTALQAFVQACPTQPSHDAPAEQERHQPSPSGQPQEHALQHQVSPLPLTEQPAHARTHQVRDEFCLDDYYKLVQEQSRVKEKEMRDLSEKRSFRFKPKHCQETLLVFQSSLKLCLTV